MEQKQVTTLNDVFNAMPEMPIDQFMKLSSIILDYVSCERQAVCDSIYKNMNTRLLQIFNKTDSDCDMCEAAQIDNDIIDNVKAE